MDENDKKVIDDQNHQLNIYNNLKNKNFTSAPSYSNLLDINNNTNISQENLGGLQNITQITQVFLISPLEILYKEQHDIFNKITKEREKCSICQIEFYDDIITNIHNIVLQDFNSYFNHEIDVIQLYKCEGHFYHIQCINEYIIIQGNTGFNCPICQKIYGIIKGDMPPGKMSAIVNNKIKCVGYENNGTIIVDYNIHSGNYKEKKFKGTHRTSYLPNTKEGRILLGLLKIAFDRKLTFRIGTSVTTGVTDIIVWNGIHHKTSICGGPTQYGYPDPTYFNRVLEELASKGVNKDDYRDNELEFLGVSLLYG